MRVTEAIRRAGAESTLGYTGAAGIHALRERIAREYDQRYRIIVAPERVVITVGASGALRLALIGCFDEGARIGIPEPFYFGYRHIMPTLGIRPVSFYPSFGNHYNQR